MHIAYVDSEAYPSATPAALQTFHTCVGLASHVDRVWLVGGLGSSANPTTFYGLPQPANLRLLRLLRFHRKQGWIRLAWSLPFHVQALAVLRHLVREVGITAVLTRNLKLAQFLLRAHRRRPLPPVVFESHQIFGDTLREEAARQGRALSAKWRRLTPRETEVYREAAGLIVLTHQLADILATRFVTRGQVRVVPDGADLRTALPVQQTAGTGPVTYLGSFHWWKGVEIPVQALALAPNLRLRLVGGDSEPRERLRALATALHVADRVQFTGPVPPPERWRYLAEASVCVLPLTRSAFGTSFTSPLKMFEYMAAARPIVASDLPALREILQDGENALLVPPEDPPAMAAAIQRLQSDQALAERLAARAAEDVRSYTWEARGRRIQEFLQAVALAQRQDSCASPRPFRAALASP
ncbi:MAG TPA: glycosyltransferase family 4 protein [Candidatus Acidoferrum sp.]|nr:glycosyltransferase family 4 protein [Candidatus Acidoferrum sp.]